MRKVNRAEIIPPSVLTEATELGQVEKSKAIEHLSKHFQDDAIDLQIVGKFPFKACKHSSVKEALESLFKGKCAYCESRYVNIHPVDIEHWRPKAMVLIYEEGSEKRHGYYWLAADWNNLLPSCIDCNRIRKHFDYSEKKIINLGKGNWFPLAVKENRTVRHDRFTPEEPLLLNPCEDDPELYLEFHEEGFISPKPDHNGQPYEKALASIRFYALNRLSLVEERKAKSLLIKQKMLNILALAECLDEENLSQQVTLLLEELLSHEFERLEDFQNSEQQFSVMAKQLIEKFKENFEWFF